MILDEMYEIVIYFYSPIPYIFILILTLSRHTVALRFNFGNIASFYLKFGLHERRLADRRSHIMNQKILQRFTCVRRRINNVKMKFYVIKVN